jgi:hypothetical protein
MTDIHIKPHGEKVAQDERRKEQRRLVIRRQTYGLLLLAGMILLWWLFHTNPRWILPAGWWRL